jgi:hypothetical protein
VGACHHDLNRIIEDTSIRLEMVQPFDQTAYVVSLSPQVEHRLEEDLGWSFVGFGER